MRWLVMTDSDTGTRRDFTGPKGGLQIFKLDSIIINLMLKTYS